MQASTVLSRSEPATDALNFQSEPKYLTHTTPSQQDATSSTDASRSLCEGKSDNLSGCSQKAGTVLADALSATQQEEGVSQSKEAVEVAAAARFISQIDSAPLDELTDPTFHFAQKPRLGGSTSVRDSIMDSTVNLSKSKITKLHTHVAPRRGRTTRPPPLKLDQVVLSSEEVQTPLPERLSSKGAPSFDLVRSGDSTVSPPDQIPSAAQDVGFKSLLPILTPESAKTFQFDFGIPAEPRLSRSESAASTISQSPPTPATGPSDDQVRKDIEAFALEQGPYLRGSQRRARKPPVIGSSEQKNETDFHSPPLKDTSIVALLPSAEPSRDLDIPSEIGDLSQPVLRRKKSIFGWLQKKPEIEVDDVLDLYLTDEQLEEVKTHKSKPHKPKLPIFRSRNATDPLPYTAG